MLLEAKRRELGRALCADILEIERIDVEIGAQERLREIDHDEVRARRMRDQVLAVRQHERERAARERSREPADALLGVAAEVELDLEVRMPVRLGDRPAGGLVANVEIEAIAALGHGVRARLDWGRHGRSVIVMRVARSAARGGATGNGRIVAKNARAGEGRRRERVRPARARHRPLRPFGRATFCSGVPTPGAAAARSPAGCAGGVARYRSAWGKSLACRLPLAACRLPPAACRLSLIACRSSRDAGRATLASGSGETHDRASCAARGHARGHTGIPACPRPPQRFPPREKRANPPIFVMSPCEARNKTRAAFVFIHMGRRPPRRARDARPPDRCAARRRKWNRYGCFQPHARCSR
ncbi:peptide chain release factor 1 [Burkholderia mallei PRL-20]|nr:peptide chain release factor 1 [Burkholderia mallei PRL-20]